MDRHAVADSQPLPPGCRFHPSENQLLCYYLHIKNSNERRSGCSFDVIKELDIDKYNPFDLPEAWSYSYGYKGRKRHWYGYCVRALNESVVRRRRRTEGGFWKRRGRIKDVVVGGGVVLGTRVSFVFYLGGLVEDAVRTNWHMHEYALVDVEPKVCLSS